MATPARNACSIVVFMVCSSPAWPPQAMLTDVIEHISASWVPSAMASGSSPISQFKSMRIRLSIFGPLCSGGGFPPAAAAGKRGGEPRERRGGAGKGGEESRLDRGGEEGGEHAPNIPAKRAE